METVQAILERRSIRKYEKDPIPDDHLKQILEACRQAPSAANRQPWHFVVIGDPAEKLRVAEACDGQTWMADAAYVLVAVGLPEVNDKWYKVDVAIAVENLVLAARGLGYGTCWIGAFDQAKVKDLCGIPANMDVVVCTPLGVPAASPAPRSRKTWEEVFSAGRYGVSLEL